MKMLVMMVRVAVTVIVVRTVEVVSVMSRHITVMTMRVNEHWCRFIDLLKVINVSEVSPAQQDKNNATFHVQCEGRTYQLQAVDETAMRKWALSLPPSPSPPPPLPPPSPPPFP